MTPDELEALADAATPGPRAVSALTNVYGDPGGGHRDVLLCAANWRAEDATLAALAPQLARDHARLLRWAEKAAGLLSYPASGECGKDEDELDGTPHKQPCFECDCAALLRECAELKEDKP